MVANSRTVFWHCISAFLFLALIGGIVPPASAEIIEVTGEGKSADWDWSKRIVQGSATSDAKYRARRQCEKQGGEPTTPAEDAPGDCTCRDREGKRIIGGSQVKAIEYSCSCSVTIDCRLGGYIELRTKLAILRAYVNDAMQDWDDAIREYLRNTLINKPRPAALAEFIDNLYGFQDRVRQFRDDIRAIQEPSLTDVYIDKMVALKEELEDDWETIGNHWNSGEIQRIIKEAEVKAAKAAKAENEAAKKDPFADALEKELMQATDADQNKKDKKAKKKKAAAQKTSQQKQKDTDPLEQALLDATRDAEKNSPAAPLESGRTSLGSSTPRYGLSQTQWDELQTKRAQEKQDLGKHLEADKRACDGSRPPFPVYQQEELPTLTLTVACEDSFEVCERRRREGERRHRERIRERARKNERIREENERVRERYEREVAHWEKTELVACLTRADKQQRHRHKMLQHKHADDDKRLAEIEALNKDLLGN